ncbi:hypothetical protein V2J09_001783 [Rumex salicifolius]
MAKRCNAVAFSLLRSVVRHRSPIPCLALSPLLYSPSSASAAAPPPPPLPAPFLNTSPISSIYRSFSSSPDLPANIVVIKSEKELNDVYKKVEGDTFASVLKLLLIKDILCGVNSMNHGLQSSTSQPSGVALELSKDIDHVKIYKVDIDLDGVAHFLSKLNISSVPTLFFFSNGKKASEVIGADTNKIKNRGSLSNDTTLLDAYMHLLHRNGGNLWEAFKCNFWKIRLLLAISVNICGGNGMKVQKTSTP